MRILMDVFFCFQTSKWNSNAHNLLSYMMIEHTTWNKRVIV